MKFGSLFTASAALAPMLVLAACGSAEDATPTPSPTDELIAGLPTPETPALPTDAQGFVDMASASDMYEVEAGKLAQDMGKSQAVKDFGAMMVKDHTKSTADLKAAAGQASGVTVAPKLTDKQQADLDALKGAGDNFDSVYKTQQLAAHQQALSLLQGYAANGDQAALKDFAGKTAPVVQGHLDQAEQLP